MPVAGAGYAIPPNGGTPSSDAPDNYTTWPRIAPLQPQSSRPSIIQLFPNAESK